MRCTPLYVSLFALSFVWSAQSAASEVEPSKQEATLLNAIARMACGRAGCTDTCQSNRDDHRMQILARYLGHFDGRAQRSAIVSMAPCTNLPGTGREPIIVFLREKAGHWKVVERLKDSLMNLVECDLRKVGAKDLLLCRESFSATGLLSANTLGNAACSIAWRKDIGLSECCVIEAYQTFYLDDCPQGTADSATIGKLHVEYRPDGTHSLRVPVTIRRVDVKPELMQAGKRAACDEAHNRLRVAERDSHFAHFQEQVHTLDFKLTEDGLDFDSAEIKAIRALRSEAVISYLDSYRF